MSWPPIDDGHSVIVYVTGHSLERWTFEPQRDAVRREAIARESDPRRDSALGVARKKMAEIFEGAPTFTDLTVVTEWPQP